MEKRAPVSQSQEVREMFHTRFDGCLVLQLIRILTLTLNVELRHNRTVKTDRRTDRRMEKWAPMSQSWEVREMFHARFDGCLVL